MPSVNSEASKILYMFFGVALLQAMMSFMFIKNKSTYDQYDTVINMSTYFMLVGICFILHLIKYIVACFHTYILLKKWTIYTVIVCSNIFFMYSIWLAATGGYILVAVYSKHNVTEYIITDMGRMLNIFTYGSIECIILYVFIIKFMIMFSKQDDIHPENRQLLANV